jgi:hypothetical protein
LKWIRRSTDRAKSSSRGIGRVVRPETALDPGFLTENVETVRGFAAQKEESRPAERRFPRERSINGSYHPSQ